MNKAIKINKVLYHGTVVPFKKIDLSKGKLYKDFGNGFYLACSKKQSISIVNKNKRVFKKTTGKLYTYEINQDALDTLWRNNRIKYFQTANIEWLDFILVSRSTNHIWHNYDVVIGPTADDDTKLVLNFYKQGEYGPVGSIRAKETLLRQLEVDNLGIQVFIATENGKSIINEATRKEEDI